MEHHAPVLSPRPPSPPAACVSLQLLAALRFLVQSAPVTLHHVDEIGERLLLVHWDVPEVSAHGLC